MRTHEQLADILTKPMKNATQFHYLRRIIMNDADAVDMPSAPRRTPTSRRGGRPRAEPLAERLALVHVLRRACGIVMWGDA